MKLIYTIIIAFIVLFVVTFSLQNTAEIQLKYSVLNWTVGESMPVYLLIFLSFFVGLILAGFFGITERFRLSRQTKKLNKQIKKMEKELATSKGLTVAEENEPSD